ADRRPARPDVGRAAGRPRLADDDRPQADRAPLLLDDAAPLRRRRRRGADDADPARGAEQHARLAEPLRRAVHDARRHDDLLLHHPDDDGAFGNYLLPLMLGARDMAFPRMNALSYWVFLGSGIFIYTSLFLGIAPNAGWFDYVPLANAVYDPGRNIEFYALGLLFNGASS